MGCPKGEHQHIGARGQMLQCHKISDPHENQEAQRYHLMALNQGAGSSSYDNELSNPRNEKKDKKRQMLTPEQKKIIDANKKKIKQFIRKLYSSKFGKLFVPIVATMTLCDTLNNRSQELAEKAKNKNEQRIAQSYQDGIDEMYGILEKHGLLDKSIDEMTDEEVQSIKSDFKKAHDNVLDEVKKTGGRKSKSYGKYRAYHDFFTKIENRTNLVEQRRLAEEKARAEGATAEAVRRIGGRRKKSELGNFYN